MLFRLDRVRRPATTSFGRAEGSEGRRIDKVLVQAIPDGVRAAEN